MRKKTEENIGIINKKNYILNIFILLFLFSTINLISATTTTLSSNPTSLSLEKGGSSQVIISYSINNTNGLSGAKGVSITGSPLFISYSGGSISFQENTTTTGTIIINANIPSNATTGTFTNSITIDGVILNIPITISQPQQSNSCMINPSLVTYTQTFQQGITDAELPKITFNPTNCEGNMAITSPFITGGIATSAGLKPVYIKSATSNEITLGVNTKDLSSLTYNTKLTLTAFGKTFTDISAITIIITGSTNPQGGFNSTNMPTCSISNTALNLNSTYNLICSNLVSDIKIEVEADSNFIRGINTEDSANQFIWSFQPKQIGNTIIKAKFKYLGNPVGDPFSAEVRISPGSTPIPGTNLKALFYQNDQRKEINQLNPGVVRVVVVDNKTDSAVQSYKLLLNGIETNNSINIESSKVYDLRISSPGFSDLVLILNSTNQQLLFDIMPNKEIYYTGESIGFNSSENDTKYIINDVIINIPYFISSPGNYTIRAYKEGFVSSNKTIVVLDLPTFTTMTPQLDKWKKGSKVIMQLNKNVSWEVKKDGVKLSSGEGDKVDFKIDGYGLWEVYSGNSRITGANIQKVSSWYNPLSWNLGLWWVPVIVGLFGVGYLYLKNGDNMSNVTPYS